MSLIFCRCRYCDRPFPAPVRATVCPACHGFRGTLRALRDGKALLRAPRHREWTKVADDAIPPVACVPALVPGRTQPNAPGLDVRRGTPEN